MKKICNRFVFEKVKTYIISNFGATTSLLNIADYFQNVEHINIKVETLNSYIEILENAKIIYKCSRFDIKSKASLRGEQKYYLADLGIYFATNVDARINYGPVLENILYTYMKAKNYRVSVGKIGKLECDFIARKDTDFYYAQVAMTIMEKTTEDREYEPYRHIRDNYPKYLFTLDTLLQKRDGVIHANMIDFMAQDKEL